MNLEQILPADIKKRSFEIITEEFGSRILDPENKAVTKRVIHITTDFDHVDNLTFPLHAVTEGLEALRPGTPIITDISMGEVGINKTTLRKTGNEVYCFMADEGVAKAAREAGTTRAIASMDKAAALSFQGKDRVLAIGNAPTALIRIKELVNQGKLHPKLIIVVPVDFVNVAQAKELILNLDTPHIVARGRKGGSNVTAAICNALLYQLYI